MLLSVFSSGWPSDKKISHVKIYTPYILVHTRGNSHELMKNHISNIRDANMFHNRVINFWNKLPDNVVLATSISSFKCRLLSFMENIGSEHFSAS